MRDGDRALSRRAALALLGGGCAVTLAPTLGFASAEAARSARVDVAEDGTALLGLDVAAAVRRNSRADLVEIANNFPQQATVTVELDESVSGTLYAPADQGRAVDVTLDPGASATIEVETSEKGTVPFRITASAGHLGVDLTRETESRAGSTKTVDADAGGPYEVSAGSAIRLDGTNSTSDGGTVKEYEWDLGGDPGRLRDADTSRPTYEAPSDVAEATEVTVELTARNNKGREDTDTATITVRPS